MIHFIKYYIIIISLIFLYSCSTTYPISKDDNLTREIKKFIKNSCPLNQYLDTSKDIFLATLYFKKNNYILSPEDITILNQVIKAYQLCQNKILVVGYISNQEAQPKSKLSLKLSYLRAYNTYKYLKKFIPLNYIYFTFCSNSRNKYIEDNPTAVLGNQRVEIIMLGSNANNCLFLCIPNEL